MSYFPFLNLRMEAAALVYFSSTCCCVPKDFQCGDKDYGDLDWFPSRRVRRQTPHGTVSGSAGTERVRRGLLEMDAL